MVCMYIRVQPVTGSFEGTIRYIEFHYIDDFQLQQENHDN